MRESMSQGMVVIHHSRNALSFVCCHVDGYQLHSPVLLAGCSGSGTVIPLRALCSLSRVTQRRPVALLRALLEYESYEVKANRR